MNYEGTQSDYSEAEGHERLDADMADESAIPSIVKSSIAETQIFTQTIPLIGKIPMCKHPLLFDFLCSLLHSPVQRLPGAP